MTTIHVFCEHEHRTFETVQGPPDSDEPHTIALWAAQELDLETEAEGDARACVRDVNLDDNGFWVVRVWGGDANHQGWSAECATLIFIA